MPVVYSQEDLRPLLASDDQFVALIDAVEGILVQQHSGIAGHAIFCGLPLDTEPNAFKMYGITGSGGATLRIFPGETNSVSTANTAYILVLDPETGGLEAILAGDDLNPLRTSVPAGVGARHLAPKGAKTVCILGSGEQARGSARSVFRALPELKELVVWSPTPANREKFAKEQAAFLEIEARAVETAEEAVGAGDIVVAAGRTRGGQAAYEASWVKPGALAISMTRSAPPELLADGQYISPTENRPQVVAIGFAGPGPKPAGGVQGAVELADVIAGKVPARKSDDQTVVFELANLYPWDHAVASWALGWAKDNAKGTTFALTGETK